MTKDPLTGALEASFSEVDPAQVTKGDIIGSVTAGGKRTGLQALYKLYTMHNAVLNLLAAPFWSEDPDVYKAMIAIVQKLKRALGRFLSMQISRSTTKRQARRSTQSQRLRSGPKPMATRAAFRRCTGRR